MRPHVEFVHVDDLVWHDAELPSARGGARQQNLSYDEEDGSATTRVRFDEDWARPGGFHAADTEWYILSGAVVLDDTVLGPGDYWRTPAGVRVPPLQVAAGSEVIVFRDFGDQAFTPSATDRAAWLPRGGNTGSREPGRLTVVHDDESLWGGNVFAGEAQKVFRLKVLYRDEADPATPGSGWLTNLCWAPPGNIGRVLEHHPVSEECFGLTGAMDYNYGHFTPGCYFFRPSHIKHAYLTDGGDGHLLLMRVNGHLINWATEDVTVRSVGEALDYTPADPATAPVLAGVPVRSRSKGTWDGTGR